MAHKTPKTQPKTKLYNQNPAPNPNPNNHQHKPSQNIKTQNPSTSKRNKIKTIKLNKHPKAQTKPPVPTTNSIKTNSDKLLNNNKHKHQPSTINTTNKATKFKTNKTNVNNNPNYNMQVSKEVNQINKTK